MCVPTLGCRCRTCTSPDPRDNRMRPSIAISWGPADSHGEPAHRVVIDTGPEFRVHALRAGIHGAAQVAGAREGSENHNVHAGMLGMDFRS